jgi:acyl-CoA reductase-like NAD-dependent aldehyde dehydrogenase
MSSPLPAPVFQLKNFIGNEFLAPVNGLYLPNYDPSTGEIYSQIPDSQNEDINLAVASAKRAFPDWAARSPEERSRLLNRLSDLIEANLEKFAEAESQDQGKPIWLARLIDIPRAIYNFRFFATSILHHVDASSIIYKPQKCVNYVIREPIGVAGLISPWNLPLYLLTWKIAPAIAMGNTCVCKPSEMTSMTAYLMAELINEAGIPPGVLNIVFGSGPSAGSALTTHPDVGMISFTGGTATAEKIIHASASGKKKLSLELGGKNPCIIFDDADLEKCLPTTVRSSFLNQGEICLCGSRLYVQSGIYDKFLQRFVEMTQQFTVGDPRDASTKCGALISKEHREKVESYIQIAIEDGGKVLCGGKRPPNLAGTRLENGYFLEPTIIIDVPHTSRAIQEEIFGPVVVVVRFEKDEEAIHFANDVKYGLAAIVWTENLKRGHRIAHQVHAGTVWVNCWMCRDLRMPFGGGKESGIGREGQEDSFDFYCEKKTICFAME